MALRLDLSEAQSGVVAVIFNYCDDNKLPLLDLKDFKKVLQFATQEGKAELEESYVPYVVETSIGLDRMFLSVLSHAFREEKLENGESRVVLKIPAVLAPIKAAILPLTKKDGMPEKAREIMKMLQLDFNCQYEEKDSIGKRYRRQDAIGTPFVVTIDDEGLNNTFTVRDRDSMEQVSLTKEQLIPYLVEKLYY